MDLDNKYLRFEATELDECSLKALQEEIGESEETKTRCLHILKRDLKELKDVLEPCLDDEFLLRFLRIAKFDSTNALQRIKRYYKQQDKLFSFCQKFVLPMSKVRRHHYIWISPYRLKNYSPVIIAKADFNHREICLEEKFYLDLICINSLSLNPITQMRGISLILDCSRLQYRLLLHFTPSLLHLGLTTLQDCLPVRIKACHVVNIPPLLNSAANLVYPFLSQKLKSRVFLHTSKDTWNILHETFSPEVLPEEYGGHLKKSCMINALENSEEFERNFFEKFQFGYLDSKPYREWLILNPPIKRNSSTEKSP